MTGTEQGGLLAHHRDDGGFHAHRTLAAIQDQRQAAIHIGKDVLRVGGTGLAGEVGRGGCKGAAALPDDGLHHRVAGHPDAHGIQTGTALRCHLRAAGHDDGQGARAERRHQQLGTLRHLTDKAGQHVRACNVDDEGVILRASLCHKDFFDGFPVAGVGCNAVHRFRRESHQLSLPQKLCTAGDACRIRRAKFRFYFHTNHRSFLL